MNNKLKSLLVNSGYAIFSNLLGMLVSSLVVLILPKLIGVTSYGYWQLYIFYVSYVGFFHFGWIDGIYLKYGGLHFDELEKGKFYSQFIIYALFQAAMAGLVFLYAAIFVHDSEKQFIFNMLAWTLFLTNLRFFIIYILQTTNRIKQSSVITMLDRLSYIILLGLLVLLGTDNYRIMIYVDIIARTLSLLYGIYCCKNILFRPISEFKLDFLEIIDNVKVGCNLMLSNIASLLIIGVVRIGIEQQWSIETFGKVSLALSISNLMMTFINAVGIVIFPMLKRMEESKLPTLYYVLRNLLMAVMLFVLILYYPLKSILGDWLPKYSESLKYMALIFPMAIYESKMSLLINTYLKALRMEKQILKVNVATVSFSVILSLFNTLIFPNLELAIFSIVMLLAFRCIYAELTVARVLHIHVLKDIFFELTLSVIFIVTGWFLTPMYATISYLICYLVYLFLKNNELKTSIKNLKLILK